MSLKKKGDKVNDFQQSGAKVNNKIEEDIEMQCWCGAKGTFDQLFDHQYLDSPCNGSGVIYCYCGGDCCVCHLHGETDCEGCDDCEDNEYF